MSRKSLQLNKKFNGLKVKSETAKPSHFLILEEKSKPKTRGGSTSAGFWLCVDFWMWYNFYR